MNTTTQLVERIAALFQQSVREEAARHGLLPIQLQVLGYLAQANHYSDLPIAVAAYFGITRGTVSQTLAVLERKGLIVKQVDGKHGKRLHLQLTPAGTAVLTDSWADRLALNQSDEDPALADALRRLLQSLQRQNNNEAFGVCRDCAHYLSEPGGHRCGLTGEPLAPPQTVKVCREWQAPERSG